MNVKGALKSLLAGALAAVVAASGTVVCFADDDDFSPPSTGVSGIVTKLTDLLDEIPDEKTDFGYNANLNIKFGKGISDALEMELKPIDVNAVINSKDGKASADINAKYDSKSLATLNTVYDSESGKIYFKVPELSDAYLSGTEEEIEKLFTDYLGEDIEIDDEETSVDISGGFDGDILSVLKDIDVAELSDHICEYIDFLEEKASAFLTDGEPVSGEIEGNAYSFTVKTYSFKGSDLKSITEVLVEKAKADDYMKEIAAKFGTTEKEYNDELDGMIEDFDDMTVAEFNAVKTLDIYYNDGVFSGYKFDDGDEFHKKVVFLDNDDVFALNIDSDDGYEKNTVSGSCVPSYGKVNGSFKSVTKGEYYEETEIVTLKDLGLDLGVLHGNVRIETVTNYEDEEPYKSVLDFTSNSTEDKLDLSLNISQDDEDIMTISLTGEEIDPVDVVIPSENVYSLADSAELTKFMSTCDFDGFMENIKNVLGDDLYSLFVDIFSEGSAEGEDPDSSDPDSEDEPDAVDPTPTTNTDSDTDKGADSDKNKGSNSKSSVTTKSGNDKSVNTGATAGLAIVSIALAGIAVMVSKKK